MHFDEVFPYYTAQPAEIMDPEPETEFVSTLPDYDLPNKRDKTNLEVFETPEHAEKPIKKKKNAEPEPNWDKLKKKPMETEENNQITLGKGGQKGICRKSIQSFFSLVSQINPLLFCLKSEYPEDDDFAVKAAQKPKNPIAEDSIALKPFDLKDPISPDTENNMPPREVDVPEKKLPDKKTKSESGVKNKGDESTVKGIGQQAADDVILDATEKVEPDSKYIKHPNKQGLIDAIKSLSN